MISNCRKIALLLSTGTAMLLASQVYAYTLTGGSNATVNTNWIAPGTYIAANGNLRILGGNSSIPGDIIIGYSTPLVSDQCVTCIIAVDGAGTTLTGQQLFIGSNRVPAGGTGIAATNPSFLEITGGGSVTVTSAAISQAVGSNGTVIINNLNSELVVTTLSLYIGQNINSNGVLTITDGGVATVQNATSDIVFGLLAGAKGTGVVDGAFSRLNSNRGILIGDGGNGELTVSNGANVLANSYIKIGTRINGTGTLTVKDGATVIANGGSFTVGERGNGTLSISTGSFVSAGNNVILGSLDIGSSGTVTVEDLNSTIEARNNFIVGNTGTGTLTVQNQGKAQTQNGDFVIGNDNTGTVNISSQGQLISARDIFAGVLSGSFGIVTVDGSNSLFQATRNMSVGDAGNASLTIRNGAEAKAVLGDIETGIGGTGNGEITVETGATLTAGKNIVIGAVGTGSLTVQSTGQVQAFDQLIVGQQLGSTGTVMVQNAGSVLAASNNITVGDAGNASLTIRNGAEVKAVLGDVETGLGGTGNGEITVETGATLTAGKNIVIGAVGTGSLTVQSTGQVQALDQLIVGQQLGSTGTVMVQNAGSVLAASNDITVGDVGGGVLTVGTGGVVRSSATQKMIVGQFGTVNIGAAAGDPLVSAGVLDLSIVDLSALGAVLNFNHTGDLSGTSDYLFTPQITGLGSVNQTGTGTTVLAAANGYSGNTTISAGRLAANSNNVFSSNSNHSILANGSLDLRNYNQTLGALSNAGNVYFGSAPGTVLTVNGNYDGQGGILHLSTVLYDSTSLTDLLVIHGNASGHSYIQVTNQGGLGALTTGDGILLVEVQGNSAANAFSLGSRVAAGAYEYNLYRGGSSDTDNWYLRSTYIPPPPPLRSPLSPPIRIIMIRNHFPIIVLRFLWLSPLCQWQWITVC